MFFVSLVGEKAITHRDGSFSCGLSQLKIKSGQNNVHHFDRNAVDNRNFDAWNAHGEGHQRLLQKLSENALNF